MADDGLTEIKKRFGGSLKIMWVCGGGGCGRTQYTHPPFQLYCHQCKTAMGRATGGILRRGLRLGGTCFERIAEQVL